MLMAQVLTLNGLILPGISKIMKNIKQSRKDEQDGFTLIEVIMYIALFSIIIGGIVGLAILATSQRQKNEVTNSVNYQGEAVMSLITQDIHGASSITTPGLGTSSSTLSLATSLVSSNPSVFSGSTSGGITSLEISQGSPAVNTLLTNSHVKVSNISFMNMGLPSTKGSILISFTITYNSTSSLQEFQYQKTFYGAASIP